MENVVQIGKCIGCGKMKRLSNLGCKDCNSISPRWTTHCNEIRTNPEFAFKCYSRLQSDNQRRIFIEIFGDGFLKNPGLFLT